MDGFGRVHTDLRLSLTDRCNLRCTYCMPAEGLDWLSKPQLLTDDELVRLVGVLAEMGVRTVRLTGGEPLLRPGLPGLMSRLAALDLTLSLTTNGLGLARQAQASGIRKLIAVIGDSNNAGSVGVHRSLGFAPVGTLKSCGWKFGKWLDIVLMEKTLGDGDSTPPEAAAE